MLAVELTTSLILVLEIVAEATLLLLIVRLTRKSEAFEARAIERTTELKDVLAQVAAATNSLIEAHNAQAHQAAAAAAAQSNFNGMDPRAARAARTDKEDERALVAADLKGQLGPVLVELWQRFFPDEWKSALARPHLAMEIFSRLAPQLKARQGQLAQLGDGGASSSSLKPAPYI